MANPFYMVQCRFDPYCRNPACKFNHSLQKRNSLSKSNLYTIPCKIEAEQNHCTKQGCTFKHNINSQCMIELQIHKQRDNIKNIQPYKEQTNSGTKDSIKYTKPCQLESQGQIPCTNAKCTYKHSIGFQSIVEQNIHKERMILSQKSKKSKYPDFISLNSETPSINEDSQQNSTNVESPNIKSTSKESIPDTELKQKSVIEKSASKESIPDTELKQKSVIEKSTSKESKSNVDIVHKRIRENSPHRESSSKRIRENSPHRESINRRTRDYSPHREFINRRTRDYSPHRESINRRTRDYSPRRESTNRRDRDYSPHRESSSKRARDYSPHRESSSKRARDYSPHRESPRRIINKQDTIEDSPSKTEIVAILKKTINYIENIIEIDDNRKESIKTLKKQEIANKQSIKDLQNDAVLRKYKLKTLIIKSEINDRNIIKYQDDNTNSKIHTACLEQQIIELKQTILELKPKL
jgi:hypothetical protein